tara:strand:+ start:126 stop:1481 length:1356 start_codon:yes stop_codon:yes gene_type:complete
MNSTTLYQRNSNGRIKQWTIEVESATVRTTWGIEDGKFQTSCRTATDCGVEGHADYLKPEENAVNIAARQVTKKIEEGYLKHRPKPASNQDQYSYKHISSFPKNMCFYKPQNSPKESAIFDLAKDDQLFCTYKRDGMMHILHKDGEGNVEFYTRRMDKTTDRFPALIEKAELMLPLNTILLGEMVLERKAASGRIYDDFEAGITRICRSDTEKSLAIQKEIGQPCYYIYDAIYVNGESLSNKTIVQRRNAITQYINITRNVMGIDNDNDGHDFSSEGNSLNSYISMCYGRKVSPYEHIDTYGHITAEGLLEYLKQKARDINIEGWVVWNPKATLPIENLVRFNGKPYRPPMCWKVKPKLEDDFIAKFDPDNSIGNWYKDTDRTKLGKAALYNIKTKEYIGDVGTGFSMKLREEMVNLKFPRIWSVEYDRKTDKGSLRFPVFLRDRTTNNDK